MKVLFLVPRRDKASTRYRVLQYLPLLGKEGISSSVKELSRTSRGWIKLLQQVGQADVVFIQKKLFTPIELFLIRSRARNLVYDFDDAVMTKDGSSSPTQQTRQLKRFAATVKRADLVIAGNAYLREQAMAFNSDVKVLPTPIDMERYRPKDEEGSGKGHLIIGWIGSRGTLKYLREISPALEQLGRRFPQLRLKIVADGFFDLDDLPVIKKNWTAEDEINDLHSFDIGLMPLEDNAWTRGKCGFKLLQCMAVGVPVVCSPVGMNREIVSDGREGLWASTTGEWVEAISRLTGDASLRQEMGRQGRATVLENYSLEVNSRTLLRYLRDVQSA